MSFKIRSSNTGPMNTPQSKRSIVREMQVCEHDTSIAFQPPEHPGPLIPRSGDFGARETGSGELRRCLASASFARQLERHPGPLVLVPQHLRLLERHQLVGVAVDDQRRGRLLGHVQICDRISLLVPPQFCLPTHSEESASLVISATQIMYWSLRLNRDSRRRAHLLRIAVSINMRNQR